MPEFRQFKKSDWASYFEVTKEAFPDDLSNGAKDEFYNRIEIPSDRFIGYFEGSELLGYAYLHLYTELAHLRRIVVNQLYRGRGHGKAIMEHVLNQFRDYSASGAMLYVETSNKVAINLYQKFDFKVNKEAWHFIIPLDDFNRDIEGISLDGFTLKELSVEDMDIVARKFPNVSKEQMQIQIFDKMRTGKSNVVFLGLYNNNELVGFSRFSRSYSGSKPFEYRQLVHADILINLLARQYKLPEKRYIRLTFDNYQELADLYTERGYKLHRHMYTMKTSL
ncbi:MAG: GNAT family N-acetyltransferase [Candidatus Kariarchaeaceae archaeon]|jgi:ribosomal-protein-alanine N-acetyltransferase